jgi:predicted PurR-regulated permease PerM
VLGGGRALAQGLFQIVVSLLMVFLFYGDGNTAADQLSATISHIDGYRGGRLLDVAETTVRAVVYGLLGTALLQGVLASIAFMVAGSGSCDSWFLDIHSGSNSGRPCTSGL